MNRSLTHRFRPVVLASAAVILLSATAVPPAAFASGAEIALKRPGHPRLTMTPDELQKLQGRSGSRPGGDRSGRKDACQNENHFLHRLFRRAPGSDHAGAASVQQEMALLDRHLQRDPRLPGSDGPRLGRRPQPQVL